MTWLQRCVSVSCIPLIVAGLYGYVMYNKHPLPHLLDAETLAKTSDSRIYDIRYRQYDLSGTLTHCLETPLITHTPENNTHHIATPHIFIVESSQQPWEIRAHHATAIQGGQQITFHHHVCIQQKKTDSSLETRLTTEELTYLPQQKKASTSRHVTITQGNNHLQSTGLIADLTTNTVQLLSHARGHYEQHPQE